MTPPAREAVEAHDTGCGPTGPGLWWAFDGQAVCLLEAVEAVKAPTGLRWTWADQPDHTEDLWTASWPCAPALLPDDVAKLRHMVGATGRDRRLWGYRNHYAPGGDAIAAMERLEAAGLVARGAPYWATNFFHATRAGCRKAGLGRTAMARAMEGRA